MKLKKLIFKGFKSYKAETVLDLTKLKDNSFCYVSGENLIDDIGGNGVGKSSLFDALCWVFTGKIPKSVTITDIANWELQQECYGEIHFDDNIITRSWNPNYLKFNDKVITQEKLYDLIGFNYESLLYSVYISQLEKNKFFDLDASIKLEIFSKILGDDVEYFDKFLDYSKNKSSKITDKITSLGVEKVTINSSIETLKNSINNISKKIKDWDENKKFYIIDKNEDIRSLENKVKNSTTLKEKYIAELKVAKKHNKSNLEKLNTLKTELKEAEKIESSIKCEIISLNEKVFNINDKLDNLHSINNTCPICCQEVTESFKAKLINDLNIERDGYRNNIESHNKNLAKLNKKEIQEKISSVSVNKDTTSLELSINKCTNDIENCLSLIERSKKDIENKKKEKNPYVLVTADNKDKIKVLVRQLNHIKFEEEELALLKSAYDYWVKNWKDVKLFYIKENLKDFELHINNNLSKLGLDKWKVILDIEGLNKSGNIKKAFTVYVKSPYNSRIVPLDAWSGGETQRIKLAGTLGLIDYINAKIGTNCNIEVYDEPTSYISDIGIDKLLNVLHERCKRLNKIVFLIDHRNFKSLGIFSNHINIIKDGEGSKIEMS